MIVPSTPPTIAPFQAAEAAAPIAAPAIAAGLEATAAVIPAVTNALTAAAPIETAAVVLTAVFMFFKITIIYFWGFVGKNLISSVTDITVFSQIIFKDLKSYGNY